MQVDYSNDFYPKIPFYMTYPMQSMYLTEMEYEKDMERMKQYYPAETKEIMELVEQRLDQLEYRFDIYLDEKKVQLKDAVNGNELFYHTIMNETSKHNYEIDFLLAKKNKIIPIEVKSSGYKTHKSLDIFTEKFSDRILCRYLVYTKDISKEQDIFCIPVYMVPFL